MRGFTLIELLVVIAILAVLSTAVVLVLNPAELIKQGRDATRISDLAALNSTISLFLVDQHNAQWNQIKNCTSGNTFPGGGAGSCTPNNSSAVDGSGWVNINFKLINGGSPLSRLPLDPNNGVAGCGITPNNICMYAYNASSTLGKYKIYANLESAKYQYRDATNLGVEGNAKDGGTNNDWYEVGSELITL